jgi:hypothetical protein
MKSQLIRLFYFVARDFCCDKMASGDASVVSRPAWSYVSYHGASDQA